LQQPCLLEERSMTCRKASASLAEYSAGALSLRQTTQLELHLKECHRCACELESRQAVMQRVESVEAYRCPAGMWESVRGRLELRARQEALAPDGLNCRKVTVSLAAYSAGSLGERHLLRIERHLRTCPKCTQEWQAFQSVLRAVESVPELAPPPYLWHKVRDRIEARSRGSAWWRAPKAIPAFAGGMTLAAVLAFAVVRHQPRSEFRPMPVDQVASNLDFVQQHAAMAQGELFSDKAALGTLVNYVPSDNRR
jgi:anti-sigma factor ChrR (cupin superfamily)